MLSTNMRRMVAVMGIVSLVACSEDQSKAPVVVDTSKPLGENELAQLFNFEGGLPAGLTEEGAKASLVETAENKALRADFTHKVYRSAVSIKAEQPWDWSGLNEYHIAVDAKNLGDESVQLYISLSDGRTEGVTSQVTGHRAMSINYATNIAAGESGTYYVILDGEFVNTDAGVREKPAPWASDDEMFVWRYGVTDFDYSDIRQVGFFVRGTLAEKSVQIDNVRIRKNPAYDLSYLAGLTDEFGQSAKHDFPIKISSEEELKKVAAEEVAALSGLMSDRSRFGGWKEGPKLEATGFFRAEKVNGKWWMVDPEGYLFFSHGPANVRMANLTSMTGVDFKDDSIRKIDSDEITPEDSIGIVNVSEEVRKTRYVSSELRNNMFTWLPDYDHPLANHYSYRRVTHRGPLKSGETFSFYRANVDRRYGHLNPQDPEGYLRKWEEVTLDRMNDWGFTSFGNWVDPAFYPNEKVPYFANGWIIGDFKTVTSGHDHWAPTPDPFDEEFVRRAKITIDVIADEIKNSPWCAGIFVDNEKSWGFPDGTVEQRYGLIINTMTRDAAESPAKAVFAQYLQDKYKDIAALNSAWESEIASWEVLASGYDSHTWSDGGVADLSVMLEMLSEEYFKVVHDTLETALPNHLYMGARMANFGMPQETIKASVKYSDVLSFNIYEEGLQHDEWAFLVDIDLPVVIGEFHIGATHETGLMHAGLVQADGQKDRGQMYIDYMESVASHNNFVGAHWFQYIDSPLTGRASDGEPYNVGFVSNTDIPYPEMVEAAKAFNSTLYTKRFNSTFGEK